MTDEKKRLSDELTAKGIPHDKRWNVEKLTSLLPQGESPPKTYTDEQIKHIADEVSGKNRLTRDELLADTTRSDGNAVTKHGIIIPPQALHRLAVTKYEYVVQCGSERCEVTRISENGRREFVRTYDKSIHGEGFKEMAEQFAKKNSTLVRTT